MDTVPPESFEIRIENRQYSGPTSDRYQESKRFNKIPCLSIDEYFETH